MADAAYVILLDLIVSRSVAAQQVTATLFAAGMKGGDGKPVKIVDPDEERASFITRLRQPLNHERVRDAVMKEVAGL